MCYIDCTFSCCSSNCCNGGCCTCCVDCDPLVCCCLEIRLVSKSDLPVTEPNNEKYTIRTQSVQKSKKESQNYGNKKTVSRNVGKEESKKNVKKKSGFNDINKSVASDESFVSPRTLKPDTPRSVSDLQVSYTSSSRRTKRTGKPTTKMKLETGNSKESQDRKSVTSSKTGSQTKRPALPQRSQKSSKKVNNVSAARDRTNTGSSAARDRNSSGSSAEGEMIEIAVEQRNVYLQSNLYKAQLMSNLPPGPDLIFGLPHGEHGAAGAFSIDEGSVLSNSYASAPLSPGTILDGQLTNRDGATSYRSMIQNHGDGPMSNRDSLMSYRRVVLGSNVAANVEGQGQQKSNSVTLTSSRPLPGPPKR